MHQVTSNAMSRRGSLLMLGAAGLAAFSNRITTRARRNRKRKGKQLNANALCKKQVNQCLDFFGTACEGDPDCLDDFVVCCPLLGTCNFDGFFICVDGERMLQGALHEPS